MGSGFPNGIFSCQWNKSEHSQGEILIPSSSISLVKVASRIQLFVTPWTVQSLEFSRQNTRVGSLSLLQGIFPTQGSNLGLPHCRWILYQLSHQGSPLPSLRSKPDFLLTLPNMEHSTQHLAQNMHILKQSNVQEVPHVVFLKLRVRVIIS